MKDETQARTFEVTQDHLREADSYFHSAGTATGMETALLRRYHQHGMTLAEAEMVCSQWEDSYMERHPGLLKAAEKIEEALEALRSAVWNAPDKYQKVAVETALFHQHRTHQQIIMKNVVLPLLDAFTLAAEENRFDARNEASCKLAQTITSRLTPSDRYLPFI